MKRPTYENNVIQGDLERTLAQCPSQCGTPKWRGHLCDYHAGYADALERADDLLTEIAQFTRTAQGLQPLDKDRK